MTVQFELVQLATSTGSLHGLVHHVEQPRGLALHIHGTWGNFYGNPFINPLASAYAELGYSFATVNVPGHDETAANERMDDFPPALAEWARLLNPQGPLILQGHSLGAIKIAYAHQQKKLPPEVRAFVLLAPFDVVQFYSGPVGGVAGLNELIHDLADDDNVPRSVFDMWPITVGTIRSATTQSGAWDQFPTRDDSAGSFVAENSLPMLVLVGGDDFAASPSPEAVINSFSASPAVTARVVPGAPHNFAGAEDAVVRHLKNWLETAVG
ncbi:hypothetical protein Aph02nite_40370 [Actinoplanes philippinensis]|uniref:Lysophospholipase, alpha-beta hydrolase superfamily n=1 Tax=Actinoplanes philippinensis TaxID=35752 RepID=A0A1I2GW42_9ACTN|nr:alpha/beta fold hydrolase [Actinoplanes philippinensis]GIE78087.1 hypothetical protein Aph02nite_40370 [Actinoplanes philippinensis]SFF20801.1 Lysophospholipase, alpha-beta hydrolase superfamily [Actinoplanes philippinensis]